MCKVEIILNSSDGVVKGLNELRVVKGFATKSSPRGAILAAEWL